MFRVLSSGMPKADFFNNLIENTVQGVSEALGNMAKGAIPKCHICLEKALPFGCIRCERYACLGHAWINMSATVLCQDCVEAFRELEKHFDVDEEEFYSEPDRQTPPPPPPPQPSPSASPSCWDVLGILPGSPPEVIKGAYRALAKKCHPDRAGSDVRKAAELQKKFTRLHEAFTSAMTESVKRGER